MKSFQQGEFERRLNSVQALMQQNDLAALLLTQEADIRYFTGFLTRFWESPTRPWFLVVPAGSRPVAVIPSIGEALMRATWIDDIRCWPAPRHSDDGVSLVIDTLKNFAPAGERIGLPSDLESHMRMPRNTYDAISAAFPGQLTSDRCCVAEVRAVKSEGEIDRIRAACAVAGRAFERVHEIARAGVALDSVFRKFQCLCLEEGADWVGYLAGGAGQGGYGDVISPATPKPLAQGDILMLDTGVVVDGYYCDFDRNFSVGAGDVHSKADHALLIEATTAAFECAQVGVQVAEVHRAMQRVLGEKCLPGRLGHGLGMQLTEGVSIIPEEQTALREGMVLTLEPGITTREGRIMVHEENILITNSGAQALSPLAQPNLPELEL